MRSRRTILGHSVHSWTVLGAFVILGGAVTVCLVTTAPLWLVPAMLLAPDLAFIVGVGEQPATPDAMARRAVPFYNTAHQPMVALAALVGAIVARSPTAIVITLVWISHIVWDRGVGYGLRNPDGTQRHHRHLASTRVGRERPSRPSASASRR